MSFIKLKMINVKFSLINIQNCQPHSECTFPNSTSLDHATRKWCKEYHNVLDQTYKCSLTYLLHGAGSFL